MRHTNVLLCMPLSRIFVGVARGLNTVATANRWVIRECETPSAIERAIAAFNPSGVVFGKGELFFSQVRPAALRGRAVVGVESDLSSRGIPSVIVDDQAVGREAANHLLERGFRHFAAFAIHNNTWAAERVSGFARRVSESGASFHAGGERFEAPGAGLAVTDEHIGRWLRSLPMPLAVFTCCDQWGRGVVAAAESAGVRVPEDVAIVGADNEEFTCELSHPPLSSVMIPWIQVGLRGGEILRQLMAAGRADALRTMVAPSSVVGRRSSETLAVEDPDVAAALSYILQRASSPIGVPDVVRATGTYRRRLEQRFSSLVGRTILDEIRRVRVELAKRFLVTTELAMPAIASAAGFSSAKRLAETSVKRWE